MNVFDAIYFNESDPVKRAFIAAETALDIAVSQALKDFEYESGLMDLSDNSVFKEAGDAVNPSKENIFVKAIKGIFNAISSFISSVIDTITGIFDKREPVTADDVKASKGSEILEKLNKASNSEMNKGKDLLKRASSDKGVSDGEIDNWIKEGIATVKAVVPPEAGAAIAALGVNKLISFLKSKKDSSKECENMTITGSGTLTDSQQKQKTKIATGFQKILKSAISPITKMVETSHKISDPKYMQDRRKQSKTYDSIEADYVAKKIDINTYFTKLHALSTIDKEIEREFGIREAEKRAQVERDKAIRALCNKALKKIDNDHKSGKITSKNADLQKVAVDQVRTEYNNSSRTETDYSTAFKALKNYILNR